MAGCVLDASAALALLAPSQTTPAARAFAAALPPGLIAPALFPGEVRHAVLKLERRGALPQAGADVALAALEREIGLAPPPSAADLARQLGLARKEGIGAYDATYLDLAMEHGASLASRDGALLQAARACGVELIDLR